MSFRKVGVNLGKRETGYMQTIVQATQDIDVSLLFNNAGYIVTGFFDKTCVALPGGAHTPLPPGPSRARGGGGVWAGEHVVHTPNLPQPWTTEDPVMSAARHSPVAKNQSDYDTGFVATRVLPSSSLTSLLSHVRMW